MHKEVSLACMLSYTILSTNIWILGFVIPGFIDAHAHWDGYDTLYPAKSWEQETFLAHGVTTLHK